MSRLAERSGPSVIWAAAEEITPPASSDQPATLPGFENIVLFSVVRVRDAVRSL